MGTSNDLLRMLDPAVRPVGPVSPARKTTPVPFEQRGFDELLAEFSQEESAAETQSNGTPVAKDTLETAQVQRENTLDLTRIENASLRDLIAQRHASSTAQNLPT